MTTPMYLKAKEVIKTIRSLSKTVNIIVGGPHPTIMPKETLKDNTEIDVAVLGEGEIIVIELVDAIRENKNLSHVNGIAFRDKDHIILTDQREYIKDLDEIPFPAWHLLPMQRYRPTASYYRQLPSYLMITSRGCAFKCAYCSQIFGKTFRYHSSQRIMSEMEILISRYNAKEIIFRDDTFTLNNTRIEILCRDIMASGLHKRVKWSCATRVDCVNEKLLKLMKRAGCWGIHFGVESGSQRLLDKIHKGIRIEQIKDAFRWSHEAGIETRAYFMLGLPGETRVDSFRTIDFAKELNPDWVQFTLTTPYPGTELFSIAQKDGTLKSKDWQFYQSWAGWADTPLPYVPSGRDPRELKELQKIALRSFYLRPNIIFKHLFLTRPSFTSFKKYLYGFLALIKSLF